MGWGDYLQDQVTLAGRIKALAVSSPKCNDLMIVTFEAEPLRGNFSGVQYAGNLWSYVQTEVGRVVAWTTFSRDMISHG